ncbi:HEAT repeat domain-containing protein [Halorubrum aethiopicum]|uniref:HEAT repeat domain-containing protein n=1 Tax=Halorubrum aethiopicum TaxID=1758255 RepID=UPI00082FB409|nr:HEAT repeat domain-containing protein [Halorubrum aethiopicum]
MTERDRPLSPERLVDLLVEGDRREAATCLDRLRTADSETRKAFLREIRDAAGERPGLFEGLAGPLAAFLTDDDRAVRLTTAKLFVALAAAEPAVVLPVADRVAARLADDEEFYYVRARCAETLGYVALESPEEVGDTAVLADLRVGLSFDEPEVREKLAKALKHVAAGDPSRLRHQVASLADHLEDDRELVRYHLCTALVVVGSEHPERLSAAAEVFRARASEDESPYVRARAAEALGVIGRSGSAVDPVPDLDAVESAFEEPPSFLTARVEFLRDVLADGARPAGPPEGPGSVESIREGTDPVVGEITSPDDGECRHCGLDLADGGPPTCPRCGAPRG